MRLLVACLGFLVLAPVAFGDGGALPAVRGGTGVAAPDGVTSYVAVGTARRTTVMRLRHGAVQAWGEVRGNWGTANVAPDAQTGLSGDGRVLVLGGMVNRYPARRSRFLVLAPRRFRFLARRRVSLRGYFTLDAVSPSGRWLYLTHYLSPRNPFRYEVRAYDLRRSRLLPKPLVDPREPDEKMFGSGITRVTGPGGRWAYTLYIRPRGGLFVHALDAAARRAFCIDLDDVPALDPSTLRMHLADGLLTVGTRATPEAVIDTRTFAVMEPGLPVIAQAAANLLLPLRAGSSAVRAADS